jgi:hypothetical protein
MRFLLKDFFSNDKIAIEASIGEADILSAQRVQNRPVGFHCQLGSHCIGLFAARGKLFVWFNDKASEVTSADAATSYSESGDSRALTLNLGPEKQIITYANSRRPISTQFYSEDEEDADFGLWLHNVLSSGERRRIFLQSWDKGSR